MTFGQKAIKYFTGLNAPGDLPSGAGVLNPYSRDEVKFCIKEFFRKFYNDNNSRIFILGINPGRFGGGLTGISFTDPVALRDYCKIGNNLGSKKELSSEFVYSFIEHYGGVGEFFSRFYLSALYPLAIIKDGKNYNYYDSRQLYASLKPFIVSTLKEQMKFGAEKSAAICLGKKNEVYLKEINRENNFFEKIITLEHPRYIMQYKRRSLGEYIKLYKNTLLNLS